MGKKIEFNKKMKCQNVVDLIDSLSFYDKENLTQEEQKIIDSFISGLKEIALTLRQSKLAIKNREENNLE